MPPVFSMPVTRPVSGHGYSDTHIRVLVAKRVRSAPGDRSASEGLEIEVNDVGETSPGREVYAITQGYLSFSYVTRQASAPPAAGPMPPIRALLMLDPAIHAGTTEGRPRHQLAMQHLEESLGHVNECFAALTYVEYEHLDLARTRQQVLALVREAVANASAPDSQYVLDSRHRIGQRRDAAPHVLGSWLARSGNTPEEYVDHLFSHARLNALVPDREAIRRAEAEPLRVPAGAAFGILAITPESPTGTPTVNCRVVLRFFDGARHLVNPAYYINALVRGRDRIDFVDDARYAALFGGTTPNKLGIPALLGSTHDPGLYAPPPGMAARLHPLIWSLTNPDDGVFAWSSGAVVSAPYPQFWVASTAAPAYHPDFDLHRIDLATTGLGRFHDHRRRVAVEGEGFAAHPIVAASRDARDRAVIHGGLYQWRLDENGYLVYRRNDGGTDDWYQPFSSRDFDSVERIWADQGVQINRFSRYFGVPCELYVGVAAKEGGSVVDSVGLEPWVAPPAHYRNQAPFTDRAFFETVPPERILDEFRSIPGIRYTLLTQVWNPIQGHWQGAVITRAPSTTRYEQGGSLVFRIRYGRVTQSGDSERLALLEDQIPEAIRSVQITYSWEELLRDMDYFGGLTSSTPQPPEARRTRRTGETVALIPASRYRRSQRFSATMDQRISPGPTQNIIGFLPTEPRIVAALELMNGPERARSIMAELRHEGFFSQQHHYNGDTRDILHTTTPPSYRFLWLMDAAHTAFITFVRWVNTLADIRPPEQLNGKIWPDEDDPTDTPTFRFTLGNEPLDPVIVVAIHGGKGDLEKFNPEATFGILMVTSGARRRWFSMPPKYNACVRLFEQFERFHSGELPLPVVRFAARRG